MERINHQQNLNQSLILQETPQMENLEKLEQLFNEELAICQKEFDQVIGFQTFINLQIIRECAAYVTQNRNSKNIIYSKQKEKLEVIEKTIINQKVNSIIKQIKDQWVNQLTNILKNISYFMDLESWISQQQEDNQPTTKQILTALDKKPKEKEQFKMSDIVQFQLANSFIETLRLKLIYFYTLNDFREYNFQNDYQYELEELNNNLSDIVLEQFKQKYKNLYQNNSYLLKAFIDSISPYIKQKVQEDTIESQNNIRTLIKLKLEYQKGLSQDIKIFLCKEYQVEEISDLFYKNELQDLQHKIDIQYSEAIIQMKKQQTNIRNAEFEQQMQNIKNLLIGKPFKSFQNQQEIIYVVYYIIYYAHVQSILPLNIIKSILDYLCNLVNNESSQSIQLALNNLNNYQDFKENNANIIKEGAGKFVQIMLNSSKDEFFLLLTQFYMIISNIQVNDSKKIVEVQPYYGYLYELRYEILKPLNKQFPQHKITFFFNFLDSYLEKKMIYQLGTYSQFENIAQNSGYLVKLSHDSQDYEILHLLRTEISKQGQDFNERVQQKFQAAMKYFKIECIKQPLPNMFQLQKVSHCQKRSRNVIIAISGFTSQDEDKQIKWKELDDLYPDSEIYALEYESLTVQYVFDSVKSNAFSSLIIPGGKILKLFQFVASSVLDNPFSKAFSQAELSGQYLAHFLHKGNLFPNCSISLIGFSLGTQVIASCLHEYKKLITFSQQPSMIASVVFMGGVVDINYIKRTYLTEVVSHRVFNCYSKKDSVLKYLLKVVQFKSVPIGLNPIEDLNNQSSQSKIINLDFTHQIDGHLPFMSNVTSILYNIDFRQEMLTKFKDKQLILVD
ncbi:hypothetical protein TTHERM_00353300 (macronuclear) [Tetrahymena thermophila SB210]|uniref:Uncharacterized protein n=1 Tax=Tetrahymena thermophila (strain SB210) TaxID=312017 RepID=I7MLQ0_TETTS|nr:hypothetical protein TTHERM_00353300 [Tetrahymena thermophila SB210]EAS02844.2 hypothetical protein TTHERM_00353300 [Tetrahymena thermophila SB210]|eukprot:XP_001023089.2 hypothetical protein TTHERM_00353300 [Tetrahymena thermophila SB210]